MCGISGFLAVRPIKAEILKNMTDIVRHRGPDDEGFSLFNRDGAAFIASGKDTFRTNDSAISYFPSKPISDFEMQDFSAGLGHRRLSIIDLSAHGHQPMSDPSSRYWITYNGEIYNYVELRDDLRSLGHQFQTESDTEIILAAYVQWGTECQSRFNGMWAFAIYDTKNESVFLSRDRFGIKPLYYWIDENGTFFFGSEIKQFTTLPSWRAILNPQRAYDYLIWGVVDHTNETMFDGVYQINPGNCVTLKSSDSFSFGESVQTNVWYELKPAKFKGSFEQAASILHQKIKDSVRLHLRSDTTVGSCLSGGLDSSAIVCIANDYLKEEGNPAPQKTFSSCSDIKEYDEKKWITQVLDGRTIEPHYIYPSMQNLFDESRKITWHQDEPFGSTSIYAQWSVFRLAAENKVRVVLDGQGADEQLAGYHNFYATQFYGLLRSGRIRKLVKEICIVKAMHGYTYKHSAARIVNMVAPDFLRNIIKKYKGKPSKNPDWLDLNVLGGAAVDPHVALGTYTHSIRALSHSQLTKSHLQALLHWEDRDSMAHSIEARVPFLDHRLVEFVLGLPDDYKLSGGVTKRILRSAISGLIPNAIRDRMDKLGFVTPEEIWIKKQGTALFRQKMQNAVDSLGGIVKPQVHDLFDDIVEGRSSFNFTIWRILNFAEWVEVFNVDITPKDVSKSSRHSG